MEDLLLSDDAVHYPVDFIKAVPSYEDKNIIIYQRLSMSDTNITQDMIENDLKYERNRPVDTKRVEDIEKYQMRHFKKYKTYDTLTPQIIFARFNDDGIERIMMIDGQHRLFAFNCLPKKDVFISVVIYKCNSSDEILQKYCRINKSVPVPEIYKDESPDDFKRKVCEGAANKFALQFPKQVSDSKKPYRPHFNREILAEALFKNKQIKKIIDPRNIDGSIQTLFDGLMKLENNYLKNLQPNEFCDPNRKPSPIFELHNKCKNGSFIGLYYYDDLRWVPKFVECNKLYDKKILK